MEWSQGGPMARLPRLIGRNRALEVLLSSEDIRAEQAEAYGYINRALPDADLDAFVEALATRIAKFDKWAIAQTKRLVSVPGRHNHCTPGLELRSVRGKQQSLWPCPIVRARSRDERSVYGQGLEKICRNRWLGVCSIQRRQTCGRGAAQNLLSLPRAC